MAIQPSSLPQPLSFPPSHFAKLAPRSYLHAHLSSPSGRRPSGRLPSESRKTSINTGSLTHCHGSAVVRNGDTAVVCGVRGEILSASDAMDYTPAVKLDELRQRYGGELTRLDEVSDSDRQRKVRTEDAEEIAYLNLLVPNVELSTGCSPSYLPGGPPSTEAQSLSHRLLTLLHTSELLSMDDLRIWFHPPSISSSAAPLPEAPHEESTSMSLDIPDSYTRDEAISEQQQPEVKAFWTLHITLLVLSLSGPPFPTLWSALLAAVRNTRLPKAWWDADREAVVCSPLTSECRLLKLSDLPIAMSFGVFDADKHGAAQLTSQRSGGEKKWILADMDGFEASCCEEEVTIVVKGKGVVGAVNLDVGSGKLEILRIEKAGGGTIGGMEMRDMVRMAGKLGRDWRGIIESS
ncbi:MAG: hypothetical protein LQ343_000775 [Gyalolechia ehrenbergii]|nr:MAG: hypothetical protein LQ343_000775 [Gyalolechia ehrenbergii]